MAKCNKVAGYQPPREPCTYILQLTESEARLLIDMDARLIQAQRYAGKCLNGISRALVSAGAKDRGPAERELMGMKDFDIGHWRDA